LSDEVGAGVAERLAEASNKPVVQPKDGFDETATDRASES
jgi:hypothetical protein